jgi:arginine decarboxylase
MTSWTPADSATLYNVPNWGSGYFGINAKGNLVVRPDGPAAGEVREIDLYELIGQVRGRGIDPPVLFRFDGILRSRVRQIHEAFRRAREEFGYEAPYRCVFPIKVNQQRHLVDSLLAEGDRHGMGIEVGSKPELLAVMALYSTRDRLIVCNGYKDREYVEMALLTSKLGTTPILVVEKFSELRTILDASEALRITPVIGVRTKLGTAGSGRWKESGGDRSKFGLTTRQIVLLVETLQEHGMLDCLQLLHFHLGSQVTHIRSIKEALREGMRTLVGLREMGAPIAYFDVGGGLGVDYDGSSTNYESSMNYSVQEYANDVVYHTREACDEAGIPQPTIISESGRALTAHHAVLVTQVMGVSDFSTVGIPANAGEEEHEIVREFAEVCENISAKTFQESYNDALHLRDTAMTLFNVGQLSLPDRARVEEFFWRACEKILRISRALPYVPDDLEHLERDMADTHFLNFSVFQSMPDSWAIRQLFPVLPLHRLNENPSRRAVLADITCDSDGKVDRFIDLKDVKRTLELHPLKEGEPYYLGFFLVGAYQEILGDMHNLFGDTHVVQVDSNGDGKPRLVHVVPGDKVQEVLSYVEYFPVELLQRLRASIERAIDEDRLSLEESAALLRRFEAGLASYTYLITPDTPS